MSLNVEALDMRISSIFEPLSLSLSSDDHVKDQRTFTDYYVGYGFFGGLTELSTDTMYAVKMAIGGTLIVTSTPVALPMTVTLNSGWTFLPCPYRTPVDLVDGAPTFAFSEGDLFKSQTRFAEFYSLIGTFYGTLLTIEPGAGYKVRTTAGGSATFEARPKIAVESELRLRCTLCSAIPQCPSL